jgi:hypothetical protein
VELTLCPRCTTLLLLQLHLLKQGRGPAAGHRSINLASTRLEEAQQWRAALQAAATSATAAASTAASTSATTSYASNSVPPWQGLTSSRSASNLFPSNGGAGSSSGSGALHRGISEGGPNSPAGRRGMCDSPLYRYFFVLWFEHVFAHLASYARASVTCLVLL